MPNQIRFSDTDKTSESPPLVGRGPLEALLFHCMTRPMFSLWESGLAMILMQQRWPPEGTSLKMRAVSESSSPASKSPSALVISSYVTHIRGSRHCSTSGFNTMHSDRDTTFDRFVCGLPTSRHGDSEGTSSSMCNVILALPASLARWLTGYWI